MINSKFVKNSVVKVFTAKDSGEGGAEKMIVLENAGFGSNRVMSMADLDKNINEVNSRKEELLTSKTKSKEELIGEKKKVIERKIERYEKMLENIALELQELDSSDKQEEVKKEYDDNIDKEIVELDESLEELNKLKEKLL